MYARITSLMLGFTLLTSSYVFADTIGKAKTAYQGVKRQFDSDPRTYLGQINAALDTVITAINQARLNTTQSKVQNKWVQDERNYINNKMASIAPAGAPVPAPAPVLPAPIPAPAPAPLAPAPAPIPAPAPAPAIAPVPAAPAGGGAPMPPAPVPPALPAPVAPIPAPLAIPALSPDQKQSYLNSLFTYVIDIADISASYSGDPVATATLVRLTKEYGVGRADSVNKLNSILNTLHIKATSGGSLVPALIAAYTLLTSFETASDQVESNRYISGGDPKAWFVRLKAANPNYSSLTPAVPPAPADVPVLLGGGYKGVVVPPAKGPASNKTIKYEAELANEYIALFEGAADRNNFQTMCRVYSDMENAFPRLTHIDSKLLNTELENARKTTEQAAIVRLFIHIKAKKDTIARRAETALIRIVKNAPTNGELFSQQKNLTTTIITLAAKGSKDAGLVAGYDMLKDLIIPADKPRDPSTPITAPEMTITDATPSGAAVSVKTPAPVRDFDVIFAEFTIAAAKHDVAAMQALHDEANGLALANPGFIDPRLNDMDDALAGAGH